MSNVQVIENENLISQFQIPNFLSSLFVGFVVIISEFRFSDLSGSLTSLHYVQAARASPFIQVRYRSRCFVFQWFTARIRVSNADFGFKKTGQ